MGTPRRIADIQPFATLAEHATTVVYKGYQSALDRFVLLKVLQPAFAADADLTARFEAEARLLARVQHPNVVAVYAFGQPEGVPYLATEFVEGVSLRALLAEGPLPPPLTAWVLAEAARGLQAAHQRGVLHRDLKPDNLMVAHDGAVKLIDFGFASLHDASAEGGGEVRGTLAYLPPEQVAGHAPTPAGDLFALGATAFELLTQRPAFHGGDIGAYFNAVLHHDPLPALAHVPGLAEPLRAVVARLLAKAPADRYPSAEALLVDLEAWLQALPHPPEAATLAAYLQDPTSYAATPVVSEPPAADQAPLAPPAPSSATSTKAPHRRRYRAWPAWAAVILIALASYASWEQWTSTTPAATRPDTTRLAIAPPISAPILPPDSLDQPARSIPSPAETPPDTSRLVATTEPDDPGPSPTQEAASPSEALTDTALLDTSRTTDPMPAPPALATLTVTCDPWAVIYVDGDSVGVTPLRTPLRLPPGDHLVSLRNPAFPTDLPVQALPVTLAPGETRSLHVRLWDYVGRLTLEVGPWAAVRIDGVARDTIPPQKRPLIVAPGTHDITLTHPVLGTWQDRFHILAGATDTLTFNLHRLLGS